MTSFPLKGGTDVADISRQLGSAAMSNRASSAPHILGKIASLGALLTGVRSWPEAPSQSDGRKPPLPTGAAQPQQPGVSINHLPRPNELPAADLDGTG